jgi:hypothetical protein
MGGRGGGGKWGGGRGGGAEGGGGGDVRGGGRRQNQVRETREDVKKFLTFYKRTKSICIDLYCPAFYKRKPYYDELADFVHDILCPTAKLRDDLLDVQLHPVKKNLFIKFKTVDSRDVVAEKLSGEGLEWPAFNTKVQGWAMDKPIVFVRVLGASPESSMQDVKGVMSQYGEVVEVRKGQLSRKLPNVTNGTWTVRMIVGEDKVIPSFVFVKDDGEIWQLAHDNQETICWQCGKQGHIGSRCKEKAVSIEHDLVAAGQQDHQLEGVPAVPVQTWAHVVRGVAGQQQADGERVAAERKAAADKAAKDKAVDDALERELAALKATEAAGREAAQKAATERQAADEAAQKADTEEEAAQKVAADMAAQKAAADEAAQREASEKEAADKAAADKAALEAAAVSQADDEAAQKAAEKNGVAHSVAQEIGVEDVVDPVKSVTISSPCDNILNPAKLSKLGAGSAVPGSCETLLGTSPDLPHKAARGNFSSWDNSDTQGLEDDKVEEVFSQYGSSISPSLSSKLGESETADLEPFSDAGSSNAMRPESASLNLE